MYTVPSNRLYPYQWAWDSAFLAIGWATVNVDRALVELESLFEGQWEDGRIPHILFRERVDSYYPGPDVWGCERSSTITNPAVFGLALERVLEHAALRVGATSVDAKVLAEVGVTRPQERIVSLLRRIEHFHGFVRRSRDPLGLHCVSCAHPWESGRDNCIAWDEALREVDIDGVDASGRRDKDKVDDPRQRPTDEAYRGYLALVAAIRESNFGPGPFAVYDPFLSTLLALSEASLGRIASWFGEDAMADRARERAEEVTSALQQLWDDEAEAYVWKNARTGAKKAQPILAAQFPLLLEIPRSARNVLEERFQAGFFGVAGDFPTVSRNSESFDPLCYWRGPQWINMTWFFRPLYRERVDENVLKLVAEHGFAEYFNPVSGAPLGARAFGWSAALTLDILARTADSP
ncbi:MAG: hypothetical protein AAGA54_05280 [Myxococcota bacterium]